MRISTKSSLRLHDRYHKWPGCRHCEFGFTAQQHRLYRFVLTLENFDYGSKLVHGIRWAKKRFLETVAKDRPM